MFSAVKFRWVVVQILFLIFALFVGVSLKNPSSQATEIGWTSGPLPSIGISAEVSTSYPKSGNRDCFQKTLQVLVLENPNPNSLKEGGVQACSVTNSLGTFGGGYVSPKTYYSYKNVITGSHAPNIIGVPNQSLFLHLETSGSFSGSKVHVFDSVQANGQFQLENSNLYRGYIYKLASPTNNPLSDANGNPIRIKEYAFSENGKWMVAEILNVGLARIDLNSQNMTLFSREFFSYSFGSSPQVSLAISDDGRHVIKSGRQAGFTRAYDLSGCVNISNFSSSTRSIAGCSERSLRDFLYSNINPAPSGDFYLHSFRFRDEGRSVKGLLETENPNKTQQITLSLDQIVEKPVSYVAMGDSFASGEGDRDDSWYEYGTNARDDPKNLCHLSKRSYPYLLSNDFGIDNFHNISCSGAKSNNVVGDKKDPSNIQYSRIESVPLGDFLPGYLVQKDYINEPFPSFITLSIGGNDLNFSGILKNCVVWSGLGSCKYADDLGARNELANQIKEEFFSLRDTYQQIVAKTHNETKIYVIGYPEFIQGTGGTCGNNVKLNGGERLFVQEATRYTNSVIEAAAKSAGVYYVDAEKALEGRHLCSGATDDLMAVNGITLGDDTSIPWYQNLGSNELIFDLGIGNESFHPNELGHQLLRDSIVNNLGNPIDFQTCADPNQKICPDSSVTPPNPNPNYFGELAQNYSSSWRSRFFEYELEKIGPLSFQTSLTNLLPGSTARVVIKSDPVEIGNYPVDQKGNVDINASIPESVPPGMHELHFYVENIAGEKIDYYKTVYLTGDEEDINDNGTPDSQDFCGFIEDSEQDYDGDGIDDACDGTIGRAATIQAPDDGVVEGEPENPDDDTSSENEFEEPDPVIIPSVNGASNNTNQASELSANLQQGGQAQSTVGSTGLQSVSNVNQDQNSSTEKLLNQGLEEQSLQVVSSPYATTSTAGTYMGPNVVTPGGGGMNWGLVLIIIGGLFVVFAALVWNKYIKTPVPSKSKPSK